MNEGIPRLNVYIDESGTNELNSEKPGVSHLFICVAIIVTDKNIVSVQSAIKEISQRLCNGAEIKSSRIGTKSERRMDFLNAIKDLSFGYYAFFVNKDRIDKNSGYQYKKTFYKNINAMLYRKITGNAGTQLRLMVDEIGSREFMDSFKEYLNKKGMPDLFINENWEFSFIKSENEPLVQLADLIAGTLSYCYDPQKINEFTSRYKDILRSHQIAYDFWPFGKIEVPEITDGSHDEINDILEKTFQNKAIQYIEANEDSGEKDEQMQAFVVKALFMARKNENRSDQSIYSDELIRILLTNGYDDFTNHKQAFTARIIGKIRRAGIIISGSNTGYRLAWSINDINDYINHDRNIIEPMIAKLKCARETVMFSTSGQYDILQQIGYDNLKTFVELFSDHQLESAIEPESDDI